MRLSILFFALLLLAGLTASAQEHTPATKKPGSGVCGPLNGQILNCPRFGFTYRVLFGWVDRTASMQEDAGADGEGSTEAGKQAEATSAKSETLLAVFERPPGAPGETINSAVVIAAEPLANYHGIKTAADYLGPITELAEKRGFKVVSEPYAFAVGTKQLVRGDFSKERGKLTMWQSSLVTIEKGYILSFTFVGGGEDEVEGLIGNLSARAVVPHTR